MHEEFEKLVQLLEKASKEGSPNINELLLRTLSFFNSLKDQFKNASDEEKKEIVVLMKEMHAKLSEEVVKMMKRTGMSEEEMMSFIRDPKHFTPEQQDILSKTGEEVEQAKKAILRDKESPEKKSSHKKHPKDKWMKS